ncbi:unnamed protein product [Ixodes pacificus]
MESSSGSTKSRSPVVVSISQFRSTSMKFLPIFDSCDSNNLREDILGFRTRLRPRAPSQQTERKNSSC